MARYSFPQCPNAEFAKKHGLLHILPLLCNSDYYGISALHGTLIRHGTCGNSKVCDYCVAGDKSPLALKYDIVTDAKAIPHNHCASGAGISYADAVNIFRQIG